MGGFEAIPPGLSRPHVYGKRGVSALPCPGRKDWLGIFRGSCWLSAKPFGKAKPGKKANGCILWQRRDAKMQIPAKKVSDLFWLATGACFHRPRISIQIPCAGGTLPRE